MITIIATLDLNNGIGIEGKLPWDNIPLDVAFSHNVTMGNKVLMGRTTYDNIGKPLPGRDNLVVSADRTYRPDGVVMIRDLHRYLPQYKKLSPILPNSNLTIIGGAEIYKQSLQYADRLIITRIHDKFKCDAEFPYFIDAFKHEQQLMCGAVEKTGVSYSITEYVRK